MEKVGIYLINSTMKRNPNRLEYEVVSRLMDSDYLNEKTGLRITLLFWLRKASLYSLKFIFYFLCF